jgi:glycosyltransferase involved in cell wall biosynthesis
MRGLDVIESPTDESLEMETSAPALRVGLVHDWLTGMRGGEKVLELLCRRFPNAPIWTLLHLSGTISETISSRDIHTSLLQVMPLATSKYRTYLPLFPLFAELNKAEDIDLVISSSHAVAKSMVKRVGDHRPYHICYIHTPMRYAWDLFDDYFGPQRVGSFASKFFFRPFVKLLQFYDVDTVDRVDLFLANSRYVAERVRRLYGRNAVVLPPPVDTERFLNTVRQPEDWYLVVSALVPYKRVDQAIRACSALGRSLKIVGKGPEAENLKRLAIALNADVSFVGYANDDELVDCYSRARALLFPGVEDFGIVPVESIACGCPVIALGVGGVLDSMTKDTAIFYNEATVASLSAAIHTFEESEWTFSEKDLRARAQLFSEENFLNQLEETLCRVYAQLSAKSTVSSVRPLAVPVTR